MPDLVTHLAASYLVKRVADPGRHMVPFLVGAALPDLLSYLPMVFTTSVPPLLDRLGSPKLAAMLTRVQHLPEFFYPFHGLLPILLMSALLAFCFAAPRRGGVFLNILLGALLHLLMDLLQVNHSGSGYLLFPFSRRPFSLDWVETETSLYALPFLIAASLATFLHDRRLRAGGRDPGGQNATEI